MNAQAETIATMRPKTKRATTRYCKFAVLKSVSHSPVIFWNSYVSKAASWFAIRSLSTPLTA